MIQLPFHFQIAPCKKGCFTCEKQFSLGEIISSSISSEDYGRQDFCAACFKEAKQEIFWKVPFRCVKGVAKEKLSPLDAEYNLLKDLLKRECFKEAIVLSLYLNRKKVLALRKDQVEGKALYEHLETGEMVLVPIQPLSSLSLPKILESLKEAPSRYES